MNRRQFSLLAAGTAACGPLDASARPAGIPSMRITKVKTVEVRGIATGKGLVLPFDPTSRSQPSLPRDRMGPAVFQEVRTGVRIKWLRMKCQPIKGR